MVGSIRRAVEKDVANIDKLMQKIASEITSAELFIADDMLFIEEHINNSGFILLYEDEIQPVGFLIVRLPGIAKDNLGRDVGLPPSELNRVAHMESVAVLKEYRGSRIQQQLLEDAEKRLIVMGYAHLMATVAPANSVSWNNFISLGYHIQLTKQKYGNLPRHILLKRI